MEFFDFLFEGLEGVVYAASKNEDKFTPQWFSWPNEKAALDQWVEQNRTTDVYVAPALFHEKGENKKDQVKVTQVTWADYDRDVLFRPSLKLDWVNITSPGHAHVYKRVGHLTDIQVIEENNKVWTKKFGADRCWAANHLLRVPGTRNQKRNWWVQDAPPLLVHLSEKGQKTFFDGNPSDDDRSKAEWFLAKTAQEAGLSKSQVLELVRQADARWGKYGDRDDYEERLNELVESVFPETPVVQIKSAEPSDLLKITELLSLDTQLDWVLKDLIYKGQIGILSGPPGVGKTQFVTDMGISMITEQRFLGWRVLSENERILYLNLEMTTQELGSIFQRQLKELSAETLQELDSRFLIKHSPGGFFLESEQARVEFEDLIETFQPTGIIVDSLSRLLQSPSDEK